MTLIPHYSQDRCHRLPQQEILMKTLIVAVSVFLFGSTAFAQLPSRTNPIFGDLYSNKSLQKDLKLTRLQLKRMKEIYLQRTPLYKLLLDKSVRDDLSVTTTQLKKMFAVIRANFAKHRKMVFDKTLTYDQRAIKRVEMLKSQEQQLLDVFTRTQKLRFQRLKGKPVKPIKKSPVKRPDV